MHVFAFMGSLWNVDDPQGHVVKSLADHWDSQDLCRVVQWIEHCPHRVAAGAQILLKAKFFSNVNRVLLTLLHSERPELHRVLAVLSAKGLIALSLSVSPIHRLSLTELLLKNPHVVAKESAAIIFDMLLSCTHTAPGDLFDYLSGL